MSAIEHDRDPDARRPLTDAMTWGERQRLWQRVYKLERDRFEAERDEARQQAEALKARLRQEVDAHRMTLHEHALPMSDEEFDELLGTIPGFEEGR